MSTKSPHVVLNYKTEPPLFECRHCGDTYPLHLPVDVEMMSAMSRVFEKNHRHCAPAPPLGETEEGTT